MPGQSLKPLLLAVPLAAVPILGPAATPTAADARRPAYVYVGSPPTLEERPRTFYVADRPGESPGYEVVVQRARWRAWGRRVATARATARWCLHGRSRCERVRARVRAQRPHDVDCPAAMRIYGLVTVSITVDGQPVRLHIDPPRLDLC